MKAVILRSCGLQQAILDATHTIEPFKIKKAAYVLAHIARVCPAQTIHLAVVDPGVGTKRRRIIVEFSKEDGPMYFVGPDNGLISVLTEEYPEYSAWSIELTPQTGAKCSSTTFGSSTTFDGRDVFAPVAAQLAAGRMPEELGDKIEELTRFTLPVPKRQDDKIIGEVLYFDSYGNAATNITAVDIGKEPLSKLLVAGEELELVDHFAECAKGVAACLVNSHGLIEIIVREGSAQKELKLIEAMRVELS